MLKVIWCDYWMNSKFVWMENLPKLLYFRTMIYD